MSKKIFPVVGVVTNLVGALVGPLHDPKLYGGWPVGLQTPNASGELLAEVVAVYVGDLDEGGQLKLMVAAVMTGALVPVYAEHVKVIRHAQS